MILNYCLGDRAEQIMNFLELLGLYDNWKEKREKKNDEFEYYGLTPKQIGICKEAKLINKIKYEEALKIRWEKIAEKAIRPNDDYHNNLLKNAIINDSKEKNIEMIELDNLEIKEDDPPIIEEMERGNKIVNDKPGTPRRRRIYV